MTRLRTAPGVGVEHRPEETRHEALAHTIVAIAGLAGCAAQTSGTATTQDDLAKMRAVNNAAKGLSVQVVWINAPQKSVRAPGG